MNEAEPEVAPFHRLSDAGEYGEAISWGLAAALVRRHPDWQIVENHFGGIYDTLRIHHVDGDHLFDLVRTGRIHLASNGLPNPVLGWNEVITDRTAAVRRLEDAAGVPSPATTPPATPRTISYRLLAAATAMTAGHRRCLRPLNGAEEYDGGYTVRKELFREFPSDIVRGATEVSPEDHYMWEHPAAHWWFLVDREHEPVCGIDTRQGVAHLLGREPRSLIDAYEAVGRRVTAMAVDLLPDTIP